MAKRGNNYRQRNENKRQMPTSQLNSTTSFQKQMAEFHFQTPHFESVMRMRGHFPRFGHLQSTNFKFATSRPTRKGHLWATLFLRFVMLLKTYLSDQYNAAFRQRSRQYSYIPNFRILIKWGGGWKNFSDLTQGSIGNKCSS